MTQASICWKNLPFERKVFVVRHARETLSSEMDWSDCLVIIGEDDTAQDAFRYVMMTERVRVKRGISGFGVSVKELPCLDDGDIVLFESQSDRLEIIFESASKTNSLYVTNACNSRCRFCPQPSSIEDGILYEVGMEVIRLVENAGEVVNVTGGEPTLLRQRFIALLKYAANKWTDTKLCILTNGRMLSDDSYVDEIFKARAAKTLGFGIPLYSDSAVMHDSVVGVKGAFAQTIRGLYKLAYKRPEIEIRFVLSKLSYKRLPRLVEFIGRNLPFIARIAVMGLEPMGHCRERWEEFWVDPEDAGEVLLDAAAKADNYNLTLLLYNMQLCCIPKELHDIACASISDWKRVYVRKCDACPMRCKCGGFLASQNEMKYLPRRFAR